MSHKKDINACSEIEHFIPTPTEITKEMKRWSQSVTATGSASERGRVGAREDPHFVQMIIVCREVQALHHQQGWRRLQQEEALLASVTLGARIKVPSPGLPYPLPEDKYPRRVSKSSACSQDLQLQSCVEGQQLAQDVFARHTSLQRGH